MLERIEKALNQVIQEIKDQAENKNEVDPELLKDLLSLFYTEIELIKENQEQGK